jgi:pimeloyl-ACP methyl ester carboxylesterase
MTTTKSTKWIDAPNRTIDVGGVPFAYRELGPARGVPVVFLHHLMAVLDEWDPRVIDGIAARRRVIAFDNRGVGASGGSVPDSVEEMGRDAIAFIRTRFLHKRISPEQAAEAITRGLCRRDAQVFRPRRWTAISRLRGILSPPLTPS